MNEKNVLTVYETGSGIENSTSSQIRTMGYDCRSYQGAEGVDRAAPGKGIIVIDAQLEAQAINKLLATVQDASPQFQPVILTGPAGKIYNSDVVGSVRNGQINVCVPVPFHKPQFDNMIRSLARVSNIQEEFTRRAGVLAQFGRSLDQMPVEAEVTPGNATLLVAGSGRQFQAVESALSNDVKVAGALTPSLAMDRLAEGDISAMVIDMSSAEFSDVMEFIRQIRRDARYFHLPLILMPVAGNSDMDDEYFSEGVSDIIHPPFEDYALQISILPLMRIALFRQALKSAYVEARQNPVADALTGLYSRGVFLTQLKQMMDSGVDFSVGLMSIDNIQAINAEHGYAGGDKIIRQIGKAIELLTRGEDLAARFSGAEFAVLMPRTDESSAKTAWKRILTVLRYTSFSPGNNSVAIEVEFNGATAQPSDGETPDRMLHRVKSLFRQPQGCC